MDVNDNAFSLNKRVALLAESAGVHALVAQGYEAGGHRGVFEPQQDTQMGTFALVRVLRYRRSGGMNFP